MKSKKPPELEVNVGGNAASPVRVHIVVRGFVQGVCFRMCAQNEAVRLGLQGWVRNLQDESVESVVEGTREAVEEYVNWCRHGPSRAQVKTIVPTFGLATGEFVDFRIR